MIKRFWIVCLLLCLLGISQVRCAADIDFEDGIMVLNSTNFNEAYRTYKQILVEFYAPWCGVCKGFAPEYVRLVKQLKRTVPHIELAKLDCDADLEFCKSQEVQSYPTLVFFDNGQIKKFDGRPNLMNVLTWFDKLIMPAEYVDSYAKLHHRRRSHEHSIVLVAPKNDPWQNVFYNLSVENPDFNWFYYHGDSSKEWSSQQPRVVVNNTDNISYTIPLAGVKDKQELLERIENHRYPRIKFYEQSYISQMVFERNKAVLFYVADTEELYQKHAELLRKVDEANEAHTPVVIFVRDRVGKHAERFLKYFGIEQFPFLLYMKQVGHLKMQKYFFRGNWNEAEINQFAQNAVAGKLKEDYKSAPVPTDQGIVKELVGSNFRDVVNGDNHVIVMFYMPNCDFCDKFIPIMTEVAEEFKKAGIQVIFSKIDNVANESGFSFIAYPTIYLFKKGNHKEPIEYKEANRTKENFLKFLEDNGLSINPKVEPKKATPPPPPKTEEKTTTQTPKTEQTASSTKTTSTPPPKAETTRESAQKSTKNSK